MLPNLRPRVQVEHDLADRAARALGVDQHQAEAAGRFAEAAANATSGEDDTVERAGAPRRFGASQRACEAPLDRDPLPWDRRGRGADVGDDCCCSSGGGGAGWAPAAAASANVPGLRSTADGRRGPRPRSARTRSTCRGYARSAYPDPRRAPVPPRPGAQQPTRARTSPWRNPPRGHTGVQLERGSLAARIPPRHDPRRTDP